jgi:pentatricopeptide repeat protein
VKGYVANNLADKAIDLFDQIQKPSEATIILLLNACAQLETQAALHLVKKVSLNIPKSFYTNIRLLTSLLDALMKCGDVSGARSLFDRSTTKTLPMYAAMMKGKS